MSKMIGQMKESSLHAAVKRWYSEPGDFIEHDLEGFVVDILRGNTVFEIQTGNFTQLRKKILKLNSNYDVRIVYPVSVERYILRVDNVTGEILKKRKSPKKAREEEIFKELVYLVPMLKEHRVAFEILKIRDQIIYINDGKGSWRRKGWSVADRRLLEILGKTIIHQPEGFLAYLPQGLPYLFTTKEVSKFGEFPIRLARQMVYCLFHLGYIHREGKLGNAWVYKRFLGTL